MDSGQWRAHIAPPPRPIPLPHPLPAGSQQWSKLTTGRWIIKNMCSSRIPTANRISMRPPIRDVQSKWSIALSGSNSNVFLPRYWLIYPVILWLTNTCPYVQSGIEYVPASHESERGENSVDTPEVTCSVDHGEWRVPAMAMCLSAKRQALLSGITTPIPGSPSQCHAADHGLPDGRREAYQWTIALVTSTPECEGKITLFHDWACFDHITRVCLCPEQSSGVNNNSQV